MTLAVFSNKVGFAADLKEPLTAGMLIPNGEQACTITGHNEKS
jgi:hypothetical protein